jgi:hypothetical protein
LAAAPADCGTRRPLHLPPELYPQKEMTMKTMMTVLLLCVFGSLAYAQPNTEGKAACWDDYKKFCSIIPEEKRNIIVECLKQNIDQLSAQCKKFIENQ